MALRPNTEDTVRRVLSEVQLQRKHQAQYPSKGLHWAPQVEATFLSLANQATVCAYRRLKEDVEALYLLGFNLFDEFAPESPDEPTPFWREALTVAFIASGGFVQRYPETASYRIAKVLANGKRIFPARFHLYEGHLSASFEAHNQRNYARLAADPLVRLQTFPVFRRIDEDRWIPLENRNPPEDE